MLFSPLPDALHRYLLERELAVLDEELADRPVGPAVLVRVADSHHAAIGKLDPTGTLDLQKERCQRIVDVKELLAREHRPACFDVCARPVGKDPLTLEAAAQTLVGKLGIRLSEIDNEEIIGWTIKRITIAIVSLATAMKQRFDRYRYPLYGPPDDLLIVDLAQAYP